MHKYLVKYPLQKSVQTLYFLNSQSIYNYTKGKSLYFPLELRSTVGSEARELRFKPVFSHISV